ncbi:15381_t:CDS:2, partial [Cetraspora pellucida]
MIRKIGVLHKYFTKSHAACQFLDDAIKILQIKGGTLKSHTKTRWSTMWDCFDSIVRLEFAFIRILSEHGNDLSNHIKDILNDLDFYKNCRIVASVLYPLKISVGCLESRTSTLADCYVHLVSLASAIYYLPNRNLEFKNYCIEKYNKRWNEFSNDTYLLAFFLHPGYHGDGIDFGKFHDITIKAAQIWKDMGHDQESCSKLLSQLRKYKLRRPPFDQLYNFNSDTAINWWETARNSKVDWELQALALRIFAITTHSASCERSFSIFGWFYGQRHTNLSLERVEGMCKLHTFYITNAKQELPYYASDTTENLLHYQIIDSMKAIEDELEEIDF